MLFLTLCIIACVQMRAADGDTFTANTQEGIVMSFKIISEIDKTVQVGNGSYASSISQSTSGAVTIPQQIEKSGVNYTVVSIGYHAFYYCEKLTSVTIPNSVKSIGEEAFNFCYGLTSVNIPNSVTNIGEDAFGYCKNLTSITIPQSVTSIGEAAFYGCGKLTTMIVDERNTKYDSRNQCNAIIETSTNMLISGFSTTIIPNSVTSIANYAFAYLNNLSMTSIVIPNSVKKIGNSSFRSCRNLTTIKIPNSVECIGDYAFESCSNLTSITISNGVTSIGQGAFSWCGLTSLTIPNSVTSIGRAAFSSCKGLTSVISKVTEPFSIDIMTFDNISSSCTLTVPYGTKETYIAKGWTEDVFKGGIIETSPNITFEDSDVKFLCVKYWDTNKDGELSEAEAAAVTTLGDVFTDDEDILYFEELRYFTGLTSIGASAFSGCTELEDVILPNNVTSIGTNAFHNCNDLEYITIPNSVTSIGAAAFKGCAWLSSVTIPNSVTSIGASAFYDCNRMTSIISEIEEPFVFGSNAFNNLSSNCLLIVPSGTKDTYIAKGWTENIFKGGIVEMELPSPIITFVDTNVKNICLSGVWDSNGDGELSKAEAAVVTSIDNRFRKKENITSFNELKYFTRLKSLEEGAFMNNIALTSITLPNSITSIGSSAFSGCTGLTSLTIPNAVTSIGAQSFFGCSGLTSIIIPKSVTSIGNAAFQGCNNLSSVVSEIEEPFTIQNSHFSDISSNCKLIVPSGTKDAYIAAGWTEDVFKGGIIEVSNSNIEFSDANVKAICVANWDINDDGELSYSEAAAVTDLGTVFKGNEDIVSFDELQYFKGVTSIGDNAFRQCFKLENINIPYGVTSIGNSAFYECQNMESVIIPNSVVSIGNSAFWYCNYKLKSLTIPNSVTSIGNYAFEYCSALSSVTMGNGVTSIGYASFRYSGLHTINIPSGVKKIESAAFEKCNGLTSIVSEMQSPPIRLDANSTIFLFSAICKLTVPYGTKETYIANGWTEDVFKGGIVEAAPDPSQLNTLAISDAEVCKGGTIVLPVNMSNIESIKGIQFDLTLPNGVTVATDAYDELAVSLTSRAHSSHSVSARQLSNGDYRIVVTSMGAKTFSDTEGNIMNITLNVAGNVEMGEYDIKVSSIALNTADNVTISPADVTATLTVTNAKPGDVNGDGSINVTDVGMVIDDILENTPANFSKAAADVNGDKVVNVTDAGLIIDIILSDGAFAKERGVMEDMLDPQ